MEELERDFERLKLAQPPKWVKARAMMAAENVIARQTRRTRYRCYAVAAVAAGISVVAVGGYVADLLAGVMGQSGPSISLPAQPVQTFGADMPGRIMPINALYSSETVKPPEAKRDAQEKAPEATEKEKPKEAPGKKDAPSE